MHVLYWIPPFVNTFLAYTYFGKWKIKNQILQKLMIDKFPKK